MTSPFLLLDLNLEETNPNIISNTTRLPHADVRGDVPHDLQELDVGGIWPVGALGKLTRLIGCCLGSLAAATAVALAPPSWSQR